MLANYHQLLLPIVQQYAGITSDLKNEVTKQHIKQCKFCQLKKNLTDLSVEATNVPNQNINVLLLKDFLYIIMVVM